MSAGEGEANGALAMRVSVSTWHRELSELAEPEATEAHPSSRVFAFTAAELESVR